MRTPGTYISAVGHVGLIGWLLLGWGLNADPLELQTMTVTTISGEDFEAISEAPRTPEPGEADPATPVQPDIDQTPPPAPTDEQQTQPTPPPDPVEQPVVEAPPPPPPEVTPPTEVVDVPPADPLPPQTPEPTPDLPVSADPTPRQEDIVAPEPTAPQPPDTPVDTAASDPVRPDPADDPIVEQDPEPPIAAPATTTAIVPDNVAPTTSARPQTRPVRPTPVAEPEDVPDVPDTPDVPAAPPTEEPADTSIEDLLSGIDLDEPTDTPAAAPAPALARGQSLTDIERGSFFNSIGEHWTVDTGAESSSITVTVTFSIGLDRRIDGDVTLESATAGSPAAQEAAFRNARRAVWTMSRSGGFRLPEDKPDAWRMARITFDPSQMRLR